MTLGENPIETIVGKGENAGYQHFLLVFQCFLFHQAEILPFNPFPNKPWFLRVCSSSLLKTLGKGEIACNEQFLLFPTVFSTRLENFLPFSSNSKLPTANSYSLEESKNLSFGKGLNHL